MESDEETVPTQSTRDETTLVMQQLEDSLYQRLPLKHLFSLSV